ncbi:hypothetical protein BN1708_020160, partial [Verticillium longisporum]
PCRRRQADAQGQRGHPRPPSPVRDCP